jgi:hypothetical protein
MSNKLRRTASGKMMRAGTGTKLAAAAGDVDCPDCDCTSTECVAVQLDNYCATASGGSGFGPVTFKIEVTANSLPTSCFDFTGGWVQPGGNGNRTYYVDVRVPNISTVGIPIDYNGLFFAHGKTTRPGAPHVEGGTGTCASPTTTVDSHVSFLQFQLVSGGLADSYVQVLRAHHIIGNVVLLGSPATLGNYEDYSTTNWCHAITTVQQKHGALGDSGFADAPWDATSGNYKFTPCPPCAIDCAGTPCVTVAVAGSNADDTVVIDPITGVHIRRLDFQGTYCYSGIVPYGGPWVELYGSAGCCWVWQQENPLSVSYAGAKLWVWYDGYEYQAIISYGDNTANTQVFRSTNGVQLECREDGKLHGALTLGMYSDVVDHNTDDTLETTAVATSTTDCGCPEDGTLCAAAIHVQFAGVGDDAGDFEMPRVGTDASWNWESTQVEIRCAEVGAPWYDPPRTLWLMDLYDQETLTNHYVFVAEITCPRCPPDNTARWTNLVDEMHLAGTLISVAYE